MRKHFYLILLAICCASCIYGGRDDDFNTSQPPTASFFEPITLSRSTFEANITVDESRPVSNAGKIYVRENILYINEKEEGFHVFDNSNPEEPKQLFFVNVSLASDLAVRNSTIYVHHAVDLVALTLDVANKSVTETSRTRDVFPPLNSPDGFPASFFNVPENEVIIGYRPKN